jgi:hypothetical protein
MERSVQAFARGAPAESVAGDRVPSADLPCRVCELETENARLRLLVGELLVANQRLREENKTARADSHSQFSL